MRGARTYDAAEEFANRDHGKTIATLWRYIWTQGSRAFRVRIVLALSCLLMAKIASVTTPILYKYLVDHFSDLSGLLVLPVGLILSYGIVRLSQSLFGELRDFLFVKVTQGTRRQIALRVFQHLHSLPLQFHLERQTGGISRVIERGTRAIRFVISFMVFNIGPTLLELSMVMGLVAYFFSYQFSLIILVTVGIYIFLTIRITEWRLKYRREMNQRDTQANTHAVDSLLNFETVKYFGNEDYEFDRYEKSLKQFEDAAIKSQGSLLLLNFGQQGVIGVGTIGILFLAAQGIVDKSMTLGDFVMVNTYMLQLFIPLNFLGFVYREIKQSLIDMDKMFEILDIEPNIKDKDDAKELELKGGAVEFDQVQFSYNNDRQIIKNLSFKVPAGETLAIVGASGLGKSTILRLLMRFYDINGGKIRIDGQDIASVTQKSLRRAIGVVPQDTVLFNDTLEFNVLYGDPNQNMLAVKEAIQQAQLEPFVESLKENSQTKVGERGLKLSGGEKQRVAIARAILRDPEILILDEATSSLDTGTERYIQESLEKLSKNRTTMIVAHRLSTIIHAHNIIVLGPEGIMESGNHHQLLEKNGEYKKMWESQHQEKGEGE